MTESNEIPETTEDDLPVQDELETLKARATLMGIAFHPTIGLAKLKAKVAEALAGDGPAESSEEDEAPEPATATAEPKETELQRRARKKKAASALVRIQVTCMNPAKSQHEGEIFTCGNSLVGSFKKYVHFNAPWHVPRIMVDVLKQRQCQIFVQVRDERGNKVRKGKLVNEFNVVELPALTEKEIKELAQRQAMASGQGL